MATSMIRDVDRAPLYCECGICEDCSDDPIEFHHPDGIVTLLPKETREEWKARVEGADHA